MYKLGRNVLFSGNPQSLNMPVLVEIMKSSAFVNTIEGACRRNLGELCAFADTIERCRRCTLRVKSVCRHKRRNLQARCNSLQSKSVYRLPVQTGVTLPVRPIVKSFCRHYRENSPERSVFKSVFRRNARVS